MRLCKSRLILVLVLIGWKSGATVCYNRDVVVWPISCMNKTKQKHPKN